METNPPIRKYKEWREFKWQWINRATEMFLLCRYVFSFFDHLKHLNVLYTVLKLVYLPLDCFILLAE